MARSGVRMVALVLALLLAGCVAAPEPLPTPFTFRSLLAAPTPVLYAPLVAGATSNLGPGAAVPHEYARWGCADAQRLGVGWLYDWSAQPPVCDDLVSVPMQWGRFDPAICPSLGPGPLVLGFNEPDRFDQAAMSPTEAAKLWRRLTVECYPEREFTSPAVCLTDGHSAAGLAWLSQWVGEYARLYGTLPPARYLAVHCFSWSTAAACIDELRKAEIVARGYGYSGMLVTEWAVLPGQIGAAAALREAELLRRWLNGNPYVVGHAWTSTRIRGTEKWWFGASNNTGLLDFASGALTPYGVWYRGE